jgi:hypothetical protein
MLRRWISGDGRNVNNVKADITELGINLLVSLSICNNLDAALVVL